MSKGKKSEFLGTIKRKKEIPKYLGKRKNQFSYDKID